MYHHKIKERARELYKSGMSLAAVAVELEMAINTVHKFVTPANMRSGNKGHAYESKYVMTPAHRKQLMNYAKNHNYVLTGVAKRFNVPISYLRHLRREAVRKGSTIPRRSNT